MRTRPFAPALCALLSPLAGCTLLIGTGDGDGAPDAGPKADAGLDDAGLDDAGLDDAGLDDAGAPDGGALADGDAGDGGARPDAGHDAGAPTDGGAPTGFALSARIGEGPSVALPGPLAPPFHVLGAGPSTWTITVENGGDEGGTLVGARLEAPAGELLFDGFSLSAPESAPLEPGQAASLDVTFEATGFEAHGATLVLETSAGERSVPLEVTVARPMGLIGGAGGRRLMTDYQDTFIDVDDDVGERLNDAMARRHFAVHGVGWGAGRFFAVGTAHVDAQPRGRLLVTSDGASWAECISRHEDDLPEYEAFLTNAEAGCTLPDEVEPLVGVAFGNGMFVAISADQSIVSTDGLTWTMGDPAIAEAPGPDDLTPALSQIVFGGGRFIAFGGARTVVSEDGVTWHDEVYHPYIVRGLAFGAGRWVAVGDVLSRWTSDDGGATWSAPVIDEQQYDARFFTLIHTDAGFVGLSEQRSWTSLDGLTWEQRGNQGRPQGVCKDPVTGEHSYVDASYNYAEETFQQVIYRSTDPLGPANGTTAAHTLTSLNDVIDQPACGFLFAPAPR